MSTDIAWPAVGIVADDLTSAADGAGPFLVAGLTARIGRRIVPRTPADIHAVDTSSRSMSEAGAERATAAAVTQLAGSRILYKTIELYAARARPHRDRGSLPRKRPRPRRRRARVSRGRPHNR